MHLFPVLLSPIRTLNTISKKVMAALELIEEVISQVPGFPDWYNVVYIEEPDIVYTYKLTDDIKNGDLKLL